MKKERTFALIIVCALLFCGCDSTGLTFDTEGLTAYDTTDISSAQSNEITSSDTSDISGDPDTTETFERYAADGCYISADRVNDGAIVGEMERKGSGLVFDGHRLEVYDKMCTEYISYIEKMLGTTIDTVTYASYEDIAPFYSENNVKELHLSLAGSYLKGYSDPDGVIFSENMKILEVFPPGREGVYTVPDGVKTISAGAFNYSKLTKVILPSSIKTYKGAFDLAPDIEIELASDE